MRTTVTLDDKLVADAKEFSGIAETSEVVRVALTRFVQHHAAQELIKLGGSQPGYKAQPRGRYFDADGRWVSTEDADRKLEIKD